MNTTENTPSRKITQGTYNEFLEFAVSRKQSKESKRIGEYSRTGSSSFTGTKSFKEAMHLANTGWDAGIKQLELEDGLLVSGNGVEIQNNVYGSAVNIGNYLQGLPDNMVEFSEVREYNLNPLTIYVSLNYSFSNSTKKALKFTKSIVELVNKYQSKNNVRLVGVFDLQFGDTRSITEVLIKDFDERFVINNIAFSFHPSFFRRIWFAVIEAEDFIYSGYGSQTSVRDLHSRLIKNNSESIMILPRLDDLNGGSFDEGNVKKINI